MDKKLRLGLRTWIEIDRGAIKNNYKIFRSLISPQTKMMGVVKSNAYGPNLIEFARELEKLGIDYLAVDSVTEGLTLRKEGIKSPILIMGYTLPEMIIKVVENNLEITVSNFDYFREIKKLNLKKKVKIHIKIDTGMHRHGFQEEDIVKVLEELKKARKIIEVIYLYTHFASAKNPAQTKETEKQIKIFNKWREAFEKAGIKPLCHTCATSGTILFSQAHFDLVRIGIGLYGLWPSTKIRSFYKNKLKLQPVLTWKAVIGEINKVKAGERIGYDFTKKLARNSKVAIIPIGYWHGYPRALSNKGQVLIRGKIAKVLGRVCMDIMMIDVTDIKNVKVRDEVIIALDEKKERMKTSPYELATRINPLIKRIYLDK